jgi:hypothetical protein
VRRHWVDLDAHGTRCVVQAYRRAAVEAWIESNRYTRTDRPVTSTASRD